MHPVLYEFSLFGFPRVVAGYGTMLVLAIVFGTCTAVFLAWRRGIDPVNILLVGLVAIAAGLFGSYLLFVLTILPEAIENPRILFAGGLVFYGGPLAGIPAGWLAARRFGIPVLHAADVGASALAIGHALGRMGCFLGGCCFGVPWNGPWAVTFTHPLAPAALPTVARHPVQLYESAVLLGIALLTQLLWPRTTRAGQAGLAYLLVYSLWRFTVEFFRGDELRGYVVPGLISTSQAIALVVTLGAGVGLVLLHRHRPRPSENRAR